MEALPSTPATAAPHVDASREDPHQLAGDELLDAVQRQLDIFLVLPQGASVAMTLWIVHTHCFRAFDISPRLALLSPEKRSGKTIALAVLERLCAAPVINTCNITTAALFRAIAAWRPTLLIDEADTFLHERQEMVGVLNAGHRRNGVVVRTEGGQFTPKSFDVWCPVAIAQIGQLKDTLTDRSLVIPMQRKAPCEVTERVTHRSLARLEELREAVALWATASQGELEVREPRVPDLMSDRAKDNWLPLMAIAEAAGGNWPERAALAARQLTSGDDEGSNTAQLLADLRDLLEVEGVERVPSERLVDGLNHLEHRSWPTWDHGRPIRPAHLAQLLKPFGIRPHAMRFGVETRRGYFRSDFTEAFLRYLEPQMPKEE